MHYTVRKYSLAILTVLLLSLSGTGLAIPTVGPLEPNRIYMSLINAEHALSQGNYAQAIEDYMKLGEMQHDPRYYQRATILAVDNHQLELALKATKSWLALTPHDEDANFAYTILLLGTQSTTELAQQLPIFFSFNLSDDNLLNFIQIITTTDPAYLKSLNDILTNIENDTKNIQYIYLIKTAIAHQLNQYETAIIDAKKLIETAPTWPLASEVYIQLLLENNQSMLAINFAKEQTQKYPEIVAFKLMYANCLIIADQKATAKKLLHNLIKQPQTHDAALYMLSNIALADNNLKLAQKYLLSLLATKTYKDYANFYLGQITEANKNYDKAIDYYAQCDGEYYFKARLKQAEILDAMDRLDDAVDLLEDTDITSDEEIKQLTLAQANLLAKNNHFDQALALLSHAIEEMPNDVDFLYARTTIDYALDKKDSVESDLRKIVAIDPQQLEALVSLGYLLSEMPNREQEALSFAQQAFALAPKHPEVLDTLGWIEFKLGNYQKAILYLKQSYAIKPDTTTATHLFQTLVKDGQLSDAKIVLDSALQNAPNDPQLKDMYKQIKP